MDANNTNTAQNSEGSVNTADKQKKTVAFLKLAAFGLLYGLWGYLLGGLSLPFAAAPFGFALLAVTDRYALSIYIGLCIYSYGKEDALLMIGAYTLLLLLRILTGIFFNSPLGKKKDEGIAVGSLFTYLFSEKLYFRLILGGLSGLFVGLVRLVRGGFTYYDMYASLIYIFAVPLAAAVFYGFFSKKAGKYQRLVGFLALAFALVYAARDIKLYGILLGAAGCMFVTLFAARKGGALLGVITGALLGLAVSIETVPLFAFSALCFGLLCPVALSLAIGASMAVAIAWGVYVQGVNILSGLASAIVAASLTYAMYDKLFASLTKKTTDIKEETRAVDISELLAKSSLEGARRKSLEARLCHAKEGIGNMSEQLYSVGSKLRAPAATDLKQICDNAFDSACVSCENRNLCWSERYRETSASLERLCNILEKRGSISTSDADDTLLLRCTRLLDILSEINHNTYLCTRTLFENDRTEIFALDYAALSSLLSELTENSDSQLMPDEALSKRLSAALLNEGIYIDALCAYGERKKEISVFVNNENLLKDKDKILSVLCEESGLLLKEEKADSAENILHLCEVPSLTVAYSKQSLCADGEGELCGDTSDILLGSDGMLYAFISDGMGSGHDAALTSEAAGMFLRTLLPSGYSPKVTLSLLNGFLQNRSGSSLCECSATVDLLTLDLYSGRASFYKSGAAPTYIFRDGSLFKLRSHTVPVGIINDLDYRKIDFEFAHDDLVVMVSDGVTDGKEECPWLFDLLRTASPSYTPERICELIVKYARTNGSPDDLSVVVVKVV